MSREHEHQPLSEKERTVLEVDTAEQIWQEALGRLQGSDMELAVFTNSAKQTAEEVEAYLKEKESSLSPEGKFFLEMTIQLRKARQRLSEMKG